MECDILYIKMILRKQCPRCGAIDTLYITKNLFFAKCSESQKIVRILTKEEKKKLKKLLKKIMPGIILGD